MPTYLCHAFRWPRRRIRTFVFLNDIMDGAPGWVIGTKSATSILRRLHQNFAEIIPDPAPNPSLAPGPSPAPAPSQNGRTHNYTRHNTPGSTVASPTQSQFQSSSTDPESSTTENKKPLRWDFDFSLPSPRVPDSQDSVLTHTWSAVKLLEEYDPLNTTEPSRPYAYVADYVARIDLGANIFEHMALYAKQQQAARCSPDWLERLRDAMEETEEVTWYVVVCDHQERPDPESDEEEEEEDDDDYDYDIDEEEEGEYHTPVPVPLQHIGEAIGEYGPGYTSGHFYHRSPMSPATTCSIRDNASGGGFSPRRPQTAKSLRFSSNPMSPVDQRPPLPQAKLKKKTSLADGLKRIFSRR